MKRFEHHVKAIIAPGSTGQFHRDGCPPTQKHQLPRFHTASALLLLGQAVIALTQAQSAPLPPHGFRFRATDQ